MEQLWNSPIECSHVSFMFNLQVTAKRIVNSERVMPLPPLSPHTQSCAISPFNSNRRGVRGVLVIISSFFVFFCLKACFPAKRQIYEIFSKQVGFY